MQEAVVLNYGFVLDINNGLIIIFGLDSSDVNYQTKDITLPISFSNSHAAAICTDHSVRTQGLVTSGCGIVNNTTLRIVHNTSYMCWTNYCIIGY